MCIPVDPMFVRSPFKSNNASLSQQKNFWQKCSDFHSRSRKCKLQRQSTAFMSAREAFVWIFIFLFQQFIFSTEDRRLHTFLHVEDFYVGLPKYFKNEQHGIENSSVNSLNSLHCPEQFTMAHQRRPECIFAFFLIFFTPLRSIVRSFLPNLFEKVSICSYLFHFFLYWSILMLQVWHLTHKPCFQLYNSTT